MTSRAFKPTRTVIASQRRSDPACCLARRKYKRGAFWFAFQRSATTRLRLFRDQLAVRLFARIFERPRLAASLAGRPAGRRLRFLSQTHVIVGGFFGSCLPGAALATLELPSVATASAVTTTAADSDVLRINLPPDTAELPRTKHNLRI